MKAPTVKRPSAFQPPQVSWLDSEDRESCPNPWVTEVTVQQLVNAVWRRIPELAREVIALDLREVLLLGDCSEFRMVLEENQVLLLLDGRAPSPQWELSVMWLLAEGFGRALVWSMVARMASGNTVFKPLPEEALTTPVARWYQSFHWWPEASNGYLGLTLQMATALALAWGFGEERAAAMHIAENPDGDRNEEEPLLPASANISYLFRERPLRHQSHDEHDTSS
jgi:hypothetical protein